MYRLLTRANLSSEGPTLKPFLQGEVMSSANRLVLPAILSAFAVLAACGSGSGFTQPVAPPTGSFSNSNLNGTYVFSVSGTDNINGAPYAIVGSFTADGNGGITSGTLDMNDAAFPSSSIAPVADADNHRRLLSRWSGRARTDDAHTFSTPFGNNIVLDFVLLDSSHGLVTSSTTTPPAAARSTCKRPEPLLPVLCFQSLWDDGNRSAVRGRGQLYRWQWWSLTGLVDVNDGGSNALPTSHLPVRCRFGPSVTPGTAASLGIKRDVRRIRHRRHASEVHRDGSDRTLGRRIFSSQHRHAHGQPGLCFGWLCAMQFDFV